MKRIDRMGEIRRNKKELGNYEMKIMIDNNAKDIWVEFQDEYKAKKHCSYDDFKKGNVKNPYHKIVWGVGYLGEGNYNPKEYRKIYDCWKDMLRRCYDPYYINKHLTYIDAYVCDEWHNFQNFAKWYEENYYECNNERMNLDKDILIKGNKIYSPETCMFTSERINKLFIKNDLDRGEFPIGVTKHSKRNNKYLEARCCTYSKEGNKKRISLGVFPLDKPFQAFTAYKHFKENYIKQVADEYKDLIPKKLYDAMYDYKVEIND